MNVAHHPIYPACDRAKASSERDERPAILIGGIRPEGMATDRTSISALKASS